MKRFAKYLKGRKHIAFIDFEGTQFSHEIIAIGAVLVTLDKNNNVKTYKEPFKIFVRAKNKIGKVVTDLTQITEEQLKNEAVSFYTALMTLKKYLGTRWKKCLFVSYGNQDLRMLNQSIAYNFEYPKDFCAQIQHNYCDILPLFSEFIRDENGNPLSLSRSCELFQVEMMEPNHDPCADAVNLARLYDAVNRNKDIVLEEYKKAVLKINHFPEPIKQVISTLLTDETVSANQFDDYIKEYIK